jgi:hypothetical protein
MEKTVLGNNKIQFYVSEKDSPILKELYAEWKQDKTWGNIGNQFKQRAVLMEQLCNAIGEPDPHKAVDLVKELLKVRELLTQSTGESDPTLAVVKLLQQQVVIQQTPAPTLQGIQNVSIDQPKAETVPEKPKKRRRIPREHLNAMKESVIDKEDS